jgi:hypothetical protein
LWCFFGISKVDSYNFFFFNFFALF